MTTRGGREHKSDVFYVAVAKGMYKLHIVRHYTKNDENYEINIISGRFSP
jgi:hypothetical protein